MKPKLQILFLALGALFVLSSCSDDDKVTQKLISKTLEVRVNQSKPVELTPNNVDLIWSSSDMNIATVDHAGVVTGVNEGTTEINIIDEVSGFKATCGVTVTAILQELTTRNIGIVAGERVAIEIAPNYDNLTWSSDNPQIATVTDEGEVLGISSGETKIKVANSATGFVDWCDVEVTMREQKLLVSGEIVMHSGQLVRVLSPDSRGVTWSVASEHVINAEDYIHSGEMEAMLLCDNTVVEVSNPYTNLKKSFTVRIEPLQTYFTEGVYEEWGAGDEELFAAESREYLRKRDHTQKYYSLVYKPTEVEMENYITEINYRMSKPDGKLYSSDLFYKYDASEFSVGGDPTTIPVFKQIWQLYRERYIYLGHVNYGSSELGLRATNYIFSSLDGKVIIEIDVTGAVALNMGELIVAHMSPESEHYQDIIKGYLIPGKPGLVGEREPVGGGAAETKVASIEQSYLQMVIGNK